MAKLQPSVNINFGNPVWKLAVDGDDLFAEVRDAGRREVSFAAVNLKTAHVNFTNLVLDEHWLAGLDGAYNGVLFLHGYQSAQSPAHQGIYAINAITGKLLWRNYTYTMHHISPNGPVVFNTTIQPAKLVLLDAQTGNIEGAYSELTTRPQIEELQLPEIIGHTPAEVSSYIPAGKVTGNVHYIEHNGYRIVSLHVLNNDLLRQIIFIVKDNNLVYKDLVTDNIQKLQPESFIMHASRLIYIQNKTTLITLNL